MMIRKTFGGLLVGAMLLPSAALAAGDVHVTIGLSHVTKDGDRKLKVSGYLHPVNKGEVCTDGRHVVIQRRKNADSDWNNIGGDNTNTSGKYSKVVGDKTGQYRVVAPSTGSCERDMSDPKSHRH